MISNTTPAYLKKNNLVFLVSIDEIVFVQLELNMIIYFVILVYPPLCDKVPMVFKTQYFLSHGHSKLK